MSKQTKKTPVVNHTRRAPVNQMTKQEKRSRASVDIARYKRQAHQAIKAVRQAKFL